MAAKTIAQVISTVEAALVASPSLGLTLIDSRQGITSATRSHNSVSVRRAATANLDLYRDKTRARVEDAIAVDLKWRLAPKDQGDSDIAAGSKEEAIINRLTGPELVAYHPRFVDVQPDPAKSGGGWQTITITIAITRDQQVGAG